LVLIRLDEYRLIRLCPLGVLPEDTTPLLSHACWAYLRRDRPGTTKGIPRPLRTKAVIGLLS
jgi:hypothetical protein